MPTTRPRSSTLTRTGRVAAAAAAVGLAAVGAGVADAGTAAASVAAYPCGYSSQGIDAHYRHCADSFILIRANWDTGTHYTTCVGPWGEVPLYHDGPHRQVNAYYVPKAPALMQNIHGEWICRTGQPDWP